MSFISIALCAGDPAAQRRHCVCVYRGSARAHQGGAVRPRACRRHLGRVPAARVGAASLLQDQHREREDQHADGRRVRRPANLHRPARLRGVRRAQAELALPVHVVRGRRALQRRCRQVLHSKVYQIFFDADIKYFSDCGKTGTLRSAT